MTGNPDERAAKAPDQVDDAEDSDAITENLRRVYDETLKEPIPDRFADLLDKLKKGQDD